MGGANRPLASCRGAVPMVSPTRTSLRPASFAIWPAVTLPLLTAAPPCSKTFTAVTVAARSAPKCSRSRTRIVPENIRTYATFSPAGPRSTLNTEPDAGASGSPSAVGRRVVSDAMSTGIPAPVAAEPKNTGWTCAAAVCAASPPQRSSSETAPPRSSTTAARNASSRPAKTSTSASTKRSSCRSWGTNDARRLPTSREHPIEIARRVKRSRTVARTRSGSAPARSILLTKRSVGTRKRCNARISTTV